MKPSVALRGIKQKINLYHYCNGAEKVVLKDLLEGKYDRDETAKEAKPVQAAGVGSAAKAAIAAKAAKKEEAAQKETTQIGD